MQTLANTCQKIMWTSTRNALTSAGSPRHTTYHMECTQPGKAACIQLTKTDMPVSVLVCTSEDPVQRQTCRSLYLFVLQKILYKDRHASLCTLYFRRSCTKTNMPISVLVCTSEDPVQRQTCQSLYLFVLQKILYKDRHADLCTCLYFRRSCTKTDMPISVLCTSEDPIQRQTCRSLYLFVLQKILYKDRHANLCTCLYFRRSCTKTDMPISVLVCTSEDPIQRQTCRSLYLFVLQKILYKDRHANLCTCLYFRRSCTKTDMPISVLVCTSEDPVQRQTCQSLYLLVLQKILYKDRHANLCTCLYFRRSCTKTDMPISVLFVLQKTLYKDRHANLCTCLYFRRSCTKTDMPISVLVYTSEDPVQRQTCQSLYLLVLQKTLYKDRHTDLCTCLYFRRPCTKTDMPISVLACTSEDPVQRQTCQSLYLFVLQKILYKDRHADLCTCLYFRRSCTKTDMPISVLVCTSEDPVQRQTCQSLYLFVFQKILYKDRHANLCTCLYFRRSCTKTDMPISVLVCTSEDPVEDGGCIGFLNVLLHVAETSRPANPSRNKIASRKSGWMVEYVNE